MSLKVVDSEDGQRQDKKIQGESLHILELYNPVSQRDEEDGVKDLPGLDYELTSKRKHTIVKQMTFIVGINTLAPTLIFFLYKYFGGNYDVNPALTYTWVTLALGTIELFQWPYRSYLLCRNDFAKSGRPLGSSNRLQFLKLFWTRQDFFGILFFLAIVIGAILLTLCCSLGGTVGSFPLLVMSIPSIVLFLGIVLALTSICTSLQIKTPFYISSLAPHQSFRPGVYFIIEDIIAVEGGGAYEFRKRISKRYEASFAFRTLMQQLNYIFTFWAFILFLVALILVVLNVQNGLNEDIVYGVVVGFSILWSAIVAMAAWHYSQRKLKQEWQSWGDKGQHQQQQQQ